MGTSQWCFILLPLTLCWEYVEVEDCACLQAAQ